jgi:putative component of membrane protein insertase Oxa1/YidC/SpoIIIJ protein YidD
LSHSIEKRPLVRPGERETDYLRLLAKYAVYAHWNIVSPVYGDRCRMKPSCSLYSHEAYRRYGFFRGAVLTFDRLMHEGNEYKVSPVVYDKAAKRYLTHDPVENNVFWWNK